MSTLPTLSIIVPTLNEATQIGATLQKLSPWRARGAEVILVDGNSIDDTVELARDVVDQVVVSESGRAIQLNAGARVANGDIVLFLHADTLLPAPPVREFDAAIASASCQWGRFDVRLDSPGLAFRIIEKMMNWRSRISGIATGDQAIFIRRELFEAVGGFPLIALMEDIELCACLKKNSQPVCIRATVTTSARRWQGSGIAATVIKMWCLRAAYFLGVSPRRLGDWYDSRRAPFN